jgi:hypothetical protein
VTLFNSNDNMPQIVLKNFWYDNIPDGISNIILGKEVSRNNKIYLTMMYTIINVILFIIITISILGLYKLIKSKTAVSMLLVFCIILPLLYYLLIPKLSGTPWRVLLSLQPGIMHILFLIPMFLLCIGILKVIFRLK